MRTFVDNHLVNHVVFALDASDSMSGRNAQQLIKIADAEIGYLAQRSSSKELDQETRVAIYDFSDDVRCIVSERDVMRLPSIKDVYKTRGMTALVDATIVALDDFKLVSEKYGDHAFLLYVLTDGMENASGYVNRAALAGRLGSLPNNVTVACLVPDIQGKQYAMRHGFPENNIAIWDVRAADGMEKVGQTIRVATENFMVSRASGIRSTTNLFSMDAATLNAQTVKQNLTAISPNDYKLIPITKPSADYEHGEYWWIKDFIEFSGYGYTADHTGYYQLAYVKGKKPSEVISPTKAVIVVEKSTGLAYGGPAARTLLGLPDNKSVRVRHNDNPDYDVYIRSSSNNRHLLGNKVLVWDPKVLATRK